MTTIGFSGHAPDDEEEEERKRQHREEARLDAAMDESEPTRSFWVGPGTVPGWLESRGIREK